MDALTVREASREKLDAWRGDLKKVGFALVKLDDGPVHSYPYDSPWLADEQFGAIYNKIRYNTLVDRARCHSLYQLALQVAEVPGDVLEVGTWRGGTGALIASCLPDKSILLADTFRGVVKSESWEHYEDATHDDTSEGLVSNYMADLGLDNVSLLTGIFPEDTGHLVEGRTFAMVYLDLDVYRSTKDAFDFVWDQVSPGGVVVFDDYGMTSACAGISRFVNEVRGDADKFFVSNVNGQAYLIKRG